MARRRKERRADNAPGAGARPPIPRWRLVLFRLIALAFPFLLLALANLVLSWMDVGYDTRLVVEAPEGADGRTFMLNPWANFAYYTARELAGPEARRFTLPKPPRVRRIVFLGGSTVQGFPYPSEIAFPRMVEHLLAAQRPGEQIEVLNAGIVGLNSFALADLVRQVVACQPDVIVIYTGHNEFYGPGGVGSTATFFTPRLYPWMTPLRRLRLVQVLGQYAGRRTAGDALIQTLPRDVAIPWGSPRLHRAEQYYRQNLQLMCNRARQHHIPVLLCQVACNLSWQSPIVSIDSLSDSQAQQRRDALLQQGQRHMAAGRWDEAVALLETATQADPGYALSWYRLAQALEKTGQKARAGDAYQKACDLDGCRFRAPSSFAAIVRQVVQQSGEGVYRADVRTELARRADGAAPGADFFLEHVHFTWRGHREVARIIAKAIHTDVLQGTWVPQRELSDEDLDEAVGVTPFDHLIAMSFMANIVTKPPLKEAPDSKEQEAWFEGEIDRLLKSLPPGDEQLFVTLNDDLKYFDLINGMGAQYLKAGDYERALKMFELSQKRQPWRIEGYVGQARALEALGRRPEAVFLIQQALQLAPNEPELKQILQQLSR